MFFDKTQIQNILKSKVATVLAILDYQGSSVCVRVCTHLSLSLSLHIYKMKKNTSYCKSLNINKTPNYHKKLLPF